MSDDPYRQEAWSENPEGAVPDPAAGQYPYGYDPGAAYVDEGQNYAAAETGYYDAEGNYIDPTQAYYDPNAGVVDPNAAYYDPSAVAGHYAEGAGVYDEAPAAPAPAPVPAPKRPAKKAAKKKVASRGPQPKLSTPRAGYRKPVQKPVYREGISFGTVLITLAALALLGVAVMVVLPKDLSKIKGSVSSPVAAEAPRNLLTEAQKVMVDRNADIAFTEEEVNHYLSRRLQGVQKGPVASIVKYRGTFIDFSHDSAEIVIEREVFGQPLTMSVKLVPEAFRGQIQYKPTNWSLGRIDLGTRTMKPIVDLFLRARTTLTDEYELLRQMTQVRFEEDRVVLDARL